MGRNQVVAGSGSQLCCVVCGGVYAAAVEAATNRVDESFRFHYRTSLSEVEITDVPGYWKRRELCGGARGGCRHQIHGCLFNEGGTYHTLSFFDPYRVNNRFSSPTKTWRLLREAERQVCRCGS